MWNSNMENPKDLIIRRHLKTIKKLLLKRAIRDGEQERSIDKFANITTTAQERLRELVPEVLKGIQVALIRNWDYYNVETEMELLIALKVKLKRHGFTSLDIITKADDPSYGYLKIIFNTTDKIK